ncbi:MAG: hypothetical protein AAF707_03410 [Pseudomonadota bacterium]
MPLALGKLEQTQKTEANDSLALAERSLLFDKLDVVGQRQKGTDDA